MCTCTWIDCSSWAHHCRRIRATWHYLLFFLQFRVFLCPRTHWKTTNKNSQTLKHTNWILMKRKQTPQTFWALLLQQYRELQRSWVEQLFFLMSSANLQTLSSHPKISATIYTSLQSFNKKKNKTEHLQNITGMCAILLFHLEKLQYQKK